MRKTARANQYNGSSRRLGDGGGKKQDTGRRDQGGLPGGAGA